jgi:hypothetical protein
MTLQVTPFFCSVEKCFTYLAVDSRTNCCAVINPLPGSVDAVNATIAAGNLICEWVLATGSDPQARIAAAVLTGQHVCACTAGPAGAGYQMELKDDQCIRLGHLHGRVAISDGHASYVFDGRIFAGCPVTAHFTVGRADPLNRLSDECTVLLHQPMEGGAPRDMCQRTLGELRNSPPLVI